MNELNLFRMNWLAVVFIVFLGLGKPLFAEDLTESQAQLEKINKELIALQDELVKKQKESNSQRQALRDVELKLGTLQKEISQLDQNILMRNKQLAALAVTKAQLEAQLGEKEQDIKAILRLAYKQNNQPLIKLLLSGERPEDLSRHLYYFSVLTQNQQDQVAAWLDDQVRLTETIAGEAKTVALLKTEKSALNERQQVLAEQKNKRSQDIKNLEVEAKSAQQSIERKEQERKQITELISTIEAKLAEMSLEFPDQIAVTGEKGDLTWPVEGRLLNRYGGVIDNSGLRWEGWLIAADDGSPVRAVHGGRVVFADFFKSNGLLVIIDHGQGVWTLYGRNQALLRDVGSWVETGDIIAEVGRSGGYNQSGLYFEVRKNGEPQNPASWLSKR